MVGESGYELWTVWCPSPCLCQDVGLCSYCPLPNISPFIQEKKQENISKKETQNRQPFKKAPLSFKILKGKIRPSQKDITAKEENFIHFPPMGSHMAPWQQKTVCPWQSHSFTRGQKNPFLDQDKFCIGHIISERDLESILDRLKTHGSSSQKCSSLWDLWEPLHRWPLILVKGFW